MKTIMVDNPEAYVTLLAERTLANERARLLENQLRALLDEKFPDYGIRNWIEYLVTMRKMMIENNGPFSREASALYEKIVNSSPEINEVYIKLLTELYLVGDLKMRMNSSSGLKLHSDGVATI